VPDDSDEIEIDTTIHPNDKKGPSL